MQRHLARLSTVNQFVLTLLSSVLIGFTYLPILTVESGFPEVLFPPLSLPFCLIPIWFVWFRSESAKQNFLWGWLSQGIYNLIGFHWIYYTAQEFGHFPPVPSALILIAYVAFSALQFPLSGWLFAVLRKRLGLRSSPWSVQILLLIGVSSALDTVFPQIFPWNFGYPWYWSHTQIFQNAEWIGFEGLSQVTYLINGLLLLGFMNLSRKKPEVEHFFQHNVKALLCLLTTIAILASLEINGQRLLRNLPPAKRHAKILFVQGNIGNHEKFYVERQSDFRTPIIDKYVDLTSEAVRNYNIATSFDEKLKPDFVFWPETAFPGYLDALRRTNPDGLRLKELVEKTGIPLITGSYAGGENDDTYNGIYLVTKASYPDMQAYHKRILLAFGEYFPFGDRLPFLYDWFPAVSKFGRGAADQTLTLNDIKMFPQICYEGLYPVQASKSYQLEANLIVNVTNDSWFGDWLEPYQHLLMTMTRSVENRISIARVTNTGISAAVASSGALIFQSPRGQEWAQVQEIPIYPTIPTFYQKIAGKVWLFWLTLFLLAFGVLVGSKLFEKHRLGTGSSEN
ncbi:MAG: apolipoprotein N-acyltransferase [Bdellovibrionales bacterium CG10_big_fil_rev_8_21_14_0_10_45_34]|nr:MAG: apolipoprotein N-acyltransferase [Bdellovibrionales bacterium CG10_big_fil_rev_8_21_14_0_10_45_34]